LEARLLLTCRLPSGRAGMGKCGKMNYHAPGLIAQLMLAQLMPGFDKAVGGRRLSG
jgi:hypothetical protein